MSPRCIFLAILILCSAACAPLSIQEIRSEPAGRRAVFETNYSDLGNCVADTVQNGSRSLWSSGLADLSYTVVHRAAIKQVSVTGRAVTMQNIPMIDILFIGQNGERSTIVETRPGGFQGIRVGGEEKQVQAWEVIEQCGRELAR